MRPKKTSRPSQLTRKCPITSSDGWMLCTLPIEHEGPHDMRSVHVGDAHEGASAHDSALERDLRRSLAEVTKERDAARRALDEAVRSDAESLRLYRSARDRADRYRHALEKIRDGFQNDNVAHGDVRHGFCQGVALAALETEQP